MAAMVPLTGKASRYPTLGCVPGPAAFALTPTPDLPMRRPGADRCQPELPRGPRLGVTAPDLPPSPVDLGVEHWWIPHRG